MANLTFLPSQLPVKTACSCLHKSDMQVSTKAKQSEAGDEMLMLDICNKTNPETHFNPLFLCIIEDIFGICQLTDESF